MGFTAKKATKQRLRGEYWTEGRSQLWPKAYPSMDPLPTRTIPKSPSPLDLAPHFLHPLRSHCQLVFSPILFLSRLFLANALYQPPLHSSFCTRNAISVSLPSKYVFQGLISACRNPRLPPAKPEAQLEALRLFLLQLPSGQETPPTSPEARHHMAQPGTALGHSNLWVGAARAADGREGRGLAPGACQLVHQLQLPFQGALDQQGYGVKQLSVLGRTSPGGEPENQGSGV